MALLNIGICPFKCKGNGLCIQKVSEYKELPQLHTADKSILATKVQTS